MVKLSNKKELLNTRHMTCDKKVVKLKVDAAPATGNFSFHLVSVRKSEAAWKLCQCYLRKTPFLFKQPFQNKKEMQS